MDPAAEDRFRTVVAGVDGTRAGFEAVRQAARLMEPGGRLILVAAEDAWDAMAARWAGVFFVEAHDLGDWDLASRHEELTRRIDASLGAARNQVADTCDAEVRRIAGRSWEVLDEQATAEAADLIAVGTHGGSWAHGALLGRTATRLAHEAPCSVLVARPPIDPRRFPDGLVVGFDGSVESERGLRIGVALSARFPGVRAELVSCRSHGPDAAVPPAPALPRTFGRRVIHAPPEDGLVHAAATADLLIVGARGLTGVRTLGSTSERVTHEASSSVLIARPKTPAAAS